MTIYNSLKYSNFIANKKLKESMLQKQLQKNKNYNILRPNISNIKLDTLKKILDNFEKNTSHISFNNKVFSLNNLDQLNYSELLFVIEYINIIFKNLLSINLSLPAQKVLVDWAFTAMEYIKAIEATMPQKINRYKKNKSICCRGLNTDFCTCNCKDHPLSTSTCDGTRFCAMCHMPDILQVVQNNYEQFYEIFKNTK